MPAISHSKKYSNYNTMMSGVCYKWLDPNNFDNPVTRRLISSVKEYIDISPNGIIIIQSQSVFVPLANKIVSLLQRGFTMQSLYQNLIHDKLGNNSFEPLFHVIERVERAFSFSSEDPTYQFESSQVLRLFLNQYNEIIKGNTYYCYLNSSQYIVIENYKYNTRIIENVREYVTNGCKDNFIKEVVVNPAVRIYNTNESRAVFRNCFSINYSSSDKLFNYEISDEVIQHPYVSDGISIYKGYNSGLPILTELVLNDRLNRNQIVKFIMGGWISGYGFIQQGLNQSLTHFGTLENFHNLPSANSCSVSLAFKQGPLSEYVITQGIGIQFNFTVTFETKGCGINYSNLLEVKIFDPNGTEVFNSSEHLGTTNISPSIDHIFSVIIPINLSQVGNYTIKVKVETIALNELSLRCALCETEKTVGFKAIDVGECCNKDPWQIYRATKNDWTKVLHNFILRRFKWSFMRRNYINDFVVFAEVRAQKFSSINGWVGEDCYMGAEVVGELWKFEKNPVSQQFECLFAMPQAWGWNSGGFGVQSSSKAEIWHAPWNNFMKVNGYKAFIKINIGNITENLHYIEKPKNCGIDTEFNEIQD